MIGQRNAISGRESVSPTHGVFCALFEGEETAGTLSVDDLSRDQVVRVTAIVRDLTGLDPFDVMRQGERFLPTTMGQVEPAPATPRVPRDLEGALLRMAGSVLSLNINSIEESASACGRQPLGHRCRIAYEWLR